jgi:hypothetical protein
MWRKKRVSKGQDEILTKPKKTKAGKGKGKLNTLLGKGKTKKAEWQSEEVDPWGARADSSSSLQLPAVAADANAGASTTQTTDANNTPGAADGDSETTSDGQSEELDPWAARADSTTSKVSDDGEPPGGGSGGRAWRESTFAGLDYSSKNSGFKMKSVKRQNPLFAQSLRTEDSKEDSIPEHHHEPPHNHTF